jgi:hypothetical protein
MQPRDETVHPYRTTLADDRAADEPAEGELSGDDLADGQPADGARPVDDWAVDDPTDAELADGASAAAPPADETFAAPADAGWAADEHRAADEAELAAEPGSAPPSAGDGRVADEPPAADLSMAEPAAGDGLAGADLSAAAAGGDETAPAAADAAPVVAVAPEAQPGGLGAEQPLIAIAEAQRLRERWRDVQASFVDDPAQAVTAAADLVEEVVQALTSGLTELRGAADEGSAAEPPTERQRVAVRQYRVVFNRLLAD